MPTLSIERERFAVRGVFTISRGSRTHAEVLTVRLDAGDGHVGRGECVPYAHYGETMDSVTEQIESLRGDLVRGLTREQLEDSLPAGAARNAVDCALWDLELKGAGNRRESAQPAAGSLRSVRTMRTLSLAPPDVMAAEAERVANLFETLKLKLGGEGDGSLDEHRVEAVHTAAPRCRLVVDANESWPATEAERRARRMAERGVALVEQPVPADDDEVLATFEHPLALCADESFHTASDVDRVATRYDVVNLKLDKTGGLTHALRARHDAEAAGLGIMVGCMLGTSLAMAPALHLAQAAEWVDLDGPYLLAEDRDPGLRLTEDGFMEPNALLWG